MRVFHDFVSRLLLVIVSESFKRARLPNTLTAAEYVTNAAIQNAKILKIGYWLAQLPYSLSERGSDR